jgi:hypothetical protein
MMHCSSTPRHLQAPAFEEAVGGHDLAARHAVEVGGDALDFIDALEERGLVVRAFGRHDAVLLVVLGVPGMAPHTT